MKLKVILGTCIAIILLQQSVAVASNPFIPWSMNDVLKPIVDVKIALPVEDFPWGKMVYDGFGSVKWDSKLKQVKMTPKVSTQEDETHAALVISDKNYKQPFELSYTMKTTKQLRTGSTPNPWEVGWAVFGYRTNGKFKYLILKPDGYGIELGESLLNDEQNFLYTSVFDQDFFPINKTYNVKIKAKDNVISVVVNGKKYMDYLMSDKDVLGVDGKFGFYTEDAAVVISNVVMKQLK